MKKVRHREIKELVQGQTADKWWSQDLNQDNLGLESVCLTCKTALLTTSIEYFPMLTPMLGAPDAFTYLIFSKPYTGRKNM